MSIFYLNKSSLYKYLEEASKKDAERAINRGQRIHGQMKGKRISNHYVMDDYHPNYGEHSERVRNKSITPLHTRDEYFGISKEEEKEILNKIKNNIKYGKATKRDYEEAQRKIQKSRHRLGYEKNNRKYGLSKYDYPDPDAKETSLSHLTPSNKTDKQYIRDASKSEDGQVPKYGANPKRSRDTDPKAAKRYFQAGKYKDININKTIEGMSKEKAAVVKRTLERGGKLPQSISQKLIKKKKDNTISPISSRVVYDDDIDEGKDPKKDGRKTVEVSYSKDDINKQKKLLKTIHTSTDPKEIQIARKQFKKNLGYSTGDTIGYPVIKRNKNGQESIFFYDTEKPKKENIKNGEKLIHKSDNSNVQSLSPSIIDREGNIASSPRIYVGKNNPVKRNGEDEDDISKYNGKYYTINNNGKNNIFKDDLADKGSKAVYIKTSKEQKVSNKK
jgi:hypothetical protein